MRNIFYFLFLFIIYLITIYFFSSGELKGDEELYITFAQNLSQGFFSPIDKINLPIGPGYSILISCFILLSIPLAVVKYLNAFFLFFSVIYFYKTLGFYCTKRTSIIFSILLGFYLPFFTKIIFITPEIFSLFLISGFLYHYIKNYKENKNSIHLIIASLYSGFLIITEIIFGYIFLILLVLYIVLFFLKKNIVLKKNIYIILFALLISSPYFLYSYSITGNFFYLSTSFGSKLYWLSSPYDEEYGDWHHSNHFNLYPELKENHYDFWMSLRKYNYIDRDEILFTKAFENIYSHPVKFFSNWIANLGRLFFSYPYSYNTQKLTTLFFLIPNFALILLSIIIFFIQKRLRLSFPKELNLTLHLGFLFLFIKSFFGGNVSDFFLLTVVLLMFIAIQYPKIRIISKTA